MSKVELSVCHRHMITSRDLVQKKFQDECTSDASRSVNIVQTAAPVMHYSDSEYLQVE